MEPPREPFADWPTQLVDERAGLHFWYLGGGVIVSQTSCEELDLFRTQRIVRVVDTIRDVEREVILRAGGVTIFHDWRSVRTLKPDSRRYLNAAARKFTPESLRAIYVATSMNPVVRMIAETYNILYSQITGKELHIVAHLGEALAEHGVVRPNRWSTIPPIVHP